MNFEDKYKELVNSIDGDNENKLEYDTSDEIWRVQMNNNCCCAIGEVDGNIIAEGSTLDELLDDMKIQIDKFNQVN